jgi:hypothetical protein
MIGQHKFLALGYGGGRLAQGVDPNVAAGVNPYPPPPPPPDPNGPPVQSAMPSAPGSSPLAAGAPPAALPPQASAAGGLPAPQRITAEQRALAEHLLRDPRTHEAGVAYAMELQKKAAEPTTYSFSVQGGVPVWGDPQHPGQVVTGAVPEALKKRVLSPAEAAHLNVPPGTVVQQQPDGSLTFEKPAQGQMVVSRPGEPYREQYIPGSQNDPTRPQQPAQGYAYAPGGRQAPISGGPADPRNPQNLLEGTKGIRSEIAPIIQQGTLLKRSFNAVNVGFQQQSGSGDLAMVTGLQKMIDEGVVQAGELNNQLQAQGLKGGIAGLMGYLQSTGKFDPVIRRKLYDTATALYARTNEDLKTRALGYKPITDRAYGDGTFENYVLPSETATQLGWGAVSPAPTAPPPAPHFQPGTLDAAIAEAVKRGLRLSPAQQKRAQELGLIR